MKTTAVTIILLLSMLAAFGQTSTTTTAQSKYQADLELMRAELAKSIAKQQEMAKVRAAMLATNGLTQKYNTNKFVYVPRYPQEYYNTNATSPAISALLNDPTIEKRMPGFKEKFAPGQKQKTTVRHNVK